MERNKENMVGQPITKSGNDEYTYVEFEGA